MSETGKLTINAPKRSHIAGFTLLELLLVMFIVGLLTNVAVVRLPLMADDDQRVKRLSSQFSYAARASVLGGRPMGLRVFVNRYEFVERGDGEWRPASHELLEPITLSDGERFEFRVPKGSSSRDVDAGRIIAIVDEFGEWPALEVLYRHPELGISQYTLARDGTLTL